MPGEQRALTEFDADAVAGDDDGDDEPSSESSSSGDVDALEERVDILEELIRQNISNIENVIDTVDRVAEQRPEAGDASDAPDSENHPPSDTDIRGYQ